VFEHFGIPLQKNVGLEVSDVIGSDTLLRCGFRFTEGGAAGSEQGPQTPFTPVPGTSSNGPSLDTLLQDQTQLKVELSVSQAGT